MPEAMFPIRPSPLKIDLSGKSEKELAEIAKRNIEAAKKALGAAADMFLGNESLGKGSTLTAEQRGAKPMPKPDFKSISKSLQKSMYKPLPK